MVRVLVTGANGHIGSNTVRSLLKRGHDVVPLVRRSSDLRGIQPLGLTLCYGDIMDVDSLVAAAEGCDVVIHTAAVYRLGAQTPDDIIQPALVGTRNVFHAAKQTDIRRLVYTSSFLTFGASDDPTHILTETDWNSTPRDPYVVAKTASEREAWALSESTGIPMVALCPAVVLGPYDYRITPSMKTLLDIVNGMGTFEMGTNIVDARDVGEAHAAAVEVGEPGRRYFVGSVNVHAKEMGAIVQDLTGRPVRHIGVGRRVAFAMATLLEWQARLTRSEPRLTHDTVYEFVQRYRYCDSSAMTRTFGIMPRGAGEIVRDALRWLLHIGRVKPALAQPLASKLAPVSTW